MAHMHTLPRKPSGPMINVPGTGKRPSSSGLKKAPPVAVDCSFADVHRACTRWLIEHDPAFRRQHEVSLDLHARRRDRQEGKPVAESADPGRAGFAFGKFADL